MSKRQHFYVATLETRHYSWLGFGLSREEALQALRARFFAHLKSTGIEEADWFYQNGVESTWEEYMSPCVQRVVPGKGYLDGEDEDE